MAGRFGLWPNAHARTPIRLAARWAAALFKTALPAVETFSSPRAWAFALLGLDAYCALEAGDLFASGMRKLLADRLMALFSASQRERLALVRRRSRLRQRAPVAGFDSNRPGDPYAALRRGRSSVASLAHVDSDRAVRMLQAGWLQKLRQDSPQARSVRSAAASRRPPRFPRALPRGARMAAKSGRTARCARLTGFLAKTTCRRR